MKITSFSFVFGLLVSATTAQAQFGAVNRVDLVPSGDPKLQEITARVFVNRQTGGGTSLTSLLANFEKPLTMKGNSLTAISGTVSVEEGETLYGGSLRAYLGQDYGALFSLLLKNGQSPTYSVYGFYELPLSGEADRAIRIQGGAGIAYSATTRSGNFSYYLRAALPLQPQFSLELGYVGTVISGGNTHSLLLGVGHKF